MTLSFSKHQHEWVAEGEMVVALMQVTEHRPSTHHKHPEFYFNVMDLRQMWKQRPVGIRINNCANPTHLPECHRALKVQCVIFNDI